MSSAATAKPDAAAATSERRSALAFIIDEEGSIRQFVSLILQGSGVDTIEFVDGASFRSTPIAQLPDMRHLPHGRSPAGRAAPWRRAPRQRHR